jgi:hypothetical protein
MKPQRYQSALDEIEATIKRHPGGWADKEALLKVCQLADKIISSEDSDSYVSDKASKVKSCAAILYSARKHNRFRSNDESGVLVLRRQIRSALQAMRVWPETRANMQRIQEETK